MAVDQERKGSSNGMTQIAGWVPVEVDARLREIAKTNRRSLSAEIGLAVEAHIDVFDAAERAEEASAA